MERSGGEMLIFRMEMMKIVGSGAPGTFSLAFQKFQTMNMNITCNNKLLKLRQSASCKV